MGPDYLLITCEHGGNAVPVRYRHLFHELQPHLETHAGYDIGALAMAKALAKSLDAPLVTSTVTRLLVDLNRSSHHGRLHAEAIRKSPREMREQILAGHYLPYRMQVESLVSKATARGKRVIHVSSHSFTPKLHGKVRTADVGLLYDPARPGEVRMCEKWKAALQQCAPHLRVRRNYPYQGKDDGFMPYLRKKFRPARYVGIEIEVNQAIVLGPSRQWSALRAAIIDSLRHVLASKQA
ncbi:MAG TPA: N-formylglutamate amidohydrolase [Burkholderiales bacterium]|nr:N-formylglutamate amidohydrolase [Burkholderiales bacterium]